MARESFIDNVTNRALNAETLTVLEEFNSPRIITTDKTNISRKIEHD